MRQEKIGRKIVSPLSYPLPRWRYWILFQSWGQFLSWVLIAVLAGSLLGGGIALLSGKAAPPFVLLIGTSVGSLVSVILARRARFTVFSVGRDALASLAAHLENKGYVLLERSGDKLVYRQNVHRLLRWDEGNVSLELDAAGVTVDGPQLFLRHLQTVLARQWLGAAPR
jgi:hypothetical protein